MSNQGDVARIRSDRRSLTTGEEWLIDQAAKSFIESAEWPKLSKLVREAARRNLTIPEMLYGIPVQDHLWRQDNDSRIVLAIPGLWRSSYSKAFVEEFLKVVKLSCDIYLSDDEGDEEGRTVINAEILRTHLGFDDELISRVVIELPFEYFLVSGGLVTATTDWWFYINPKIGLFRDFVSVDDYLDVRSSIFSPSTPDTFQTEVPISEEVDVLINTPTTFNNLYTLTSLGVIGTATNTIASLVE